MKHRPELTPLLPRYAIVYPDADKCMILVTNPSRDVAIVILRRDRCPGTQANDVASTRIGNSLIAPLEHNHYPSISFEGDLVQFLRRNVRFAINHVV